MGRKCLSCDGEVEHSANTSGARFTFVCKDCGRESYWVKWQPFLGHGWTPMGFDR